MADRQATAASGTMRGMSKPPRISRSELVGFWMIVAIVGLPIVLYAAGWSLKLLAEL